MLKSIAIERYENYLLGKNRISLNGEAPEKERAAIEIVRYAIVELLGWTAEEAEEHLTWEIVHKMKLHKVFKYINFPVDIDPKRDVEYLACLAYPDHPYNIRRQVLRVYRRIMRGELERFPKKIFEGSRGKEKGGILLGEFINNNFIVNSTDELYEKFSNMAKINNMFRDAKIYAAARKLYLTPLDFLHYSLGEEDRDDFLYSFWQYTNVSRYAESELITERKEAAKKAVAEEEK